LRKIGTPLSGAADVERKRCYYVQGGGLMRKSQGVILLAAVLLAGGLGYTLDRAKSGSGPTKKSSKAGVVAKPVATPSPIPAAPPSTTPKPAAPPAPVAPVRELPQPEPTLQEMTAAATQPGQRAALSVAYPFNQSVFPPESIPPTFRWDDSTKAGLWLVSVQTSGSEPLRVLVREPQWKPTDAEWDALKAHSREQAARVTLAGMDASRAVVSQGRVAFRTSNDEVGAPIFYREVNLPFVEAVKDPSKIRWRFGSVASKEMPPVILEGLPVCGNCHSFNANAQSMGMDVDYANSKGSYAIVPVRDEIVLAASNIITWDDYKPEDHDNTYGLLSQMSPDGRYVISTVKDRSVFVPKPDLAFSQLFFPIKGVLVAYDTATKTFAAVAGADDKKYVQSNPAWSPDGKTLVFARCEAYQLRVDKKKGALLTEEECREFLEEGKPFKFDLYTIPFKAAPGTAAQPLAGASNNGMSNYFPKYSPDGKWIVFCRAKDYMLLQPDSELYIVPAQGGEARRMECNTSRMNSWHSWSPNGKWLVFSSKALSSYTQLFLTHLDENGHSTPPVLLEQFTSSDRAANIPEFLNAPPTAIRKIQQAFVDDTSYRRAADEFIRGGDYAGAETHYLKSLEVNPNNVEALAKYGFLLLTYLKNADKSIEVLSKAVQLSPGYCDAQHNLGIAFIEKNRFPEAESHLKEAARLDPENFESRVNLAWALSAQNKWPEATAELETALKIQPDSAQAQNRMGQALYHQGQADPARACFEKAVALDPKLAEARYNLGAILAEARKFPESLAHLEVATQLEPAKISWLEFYGRVLIESGDPERGQETLERVLKKDSSNVSAHRSLGWICVQRGAFDEAARHFATVVSSNPQDASARFDHGMALVYLGQSESGKNELIEAVRLNPSLARQVVGALQGMSENGKRDLALALREEILKILKASGQTAILDEFTKNTVALK
jgi:tetratricopeptide (TPR) repeat protein